MIWPRFVVYFCIGGGYGSSHGGSKSGMPKGFQQAFLPTLIGLFGGDASVLPKRFQSGANRTSALGGLSLDPSVTGDVMAGYQRMASPNYTMNLAQDPTIANLLASINQQSQQGLGEANAALRSRFAQAGHTSTGKSDPLLQAQSDAGVRAQQNTDALTAQAMFGELQNREGQQTNALQLLQQLNLLPANLLQSLGPLLNASSSSSNSANYSGSIGCWVAREVYGEDNPRWRLFRLWLFGEAPQLLRWIYLKFGERFARWIHDKPRIKSILRAQMERVLVCNT